jgi:AcrR family transcriptional regulator
MALKAAIRVFSDHGYKGTSTDALLEAMGISRQSMYDTFGDKRTALAGCPSAIQRGQHLGYHGKLE